MATEKTEDKPLAEELAEQTARFTALMARIAASPDPANLTMTIPEAAVYVPMTPGQLSQLRYTGTGPKFLKPAPRTVLYKKGDLDEWLNASVQNTTATTDDEAEQRAAKIEAYKKAVAA